MMNIAPVLSISSDFTYDTFISNIATLSRSLRKYMGLKVPDAVRGHSGALLEFQDRHNLLLHNLSLCQQYASVLKRWTAEFDCQLNKIYCPSAANNIPLVPPPSNQVSQLSMSQYHKSSMTSHHQDPAMTSQCKDSNMTAMIVKAERMEPEENTQGYFQSTPTTTTINRETSIKGCEASIWGPLLKRSQPTQTDFRYYDAEMLWRSRYAAMQNSKETQTDNDSSSFIQQQLYNEMNPPQIETAPPPSPIVNSSPSCCEDEGCLHEAYTGLKQFSYLKSLPPQDVTKQQDESNKDEEMNGISEENESNGTTSDQQNNDAENKIPNITEETFDYSETVDERISALGREHDIPVEHYNILAGGMKFTCFYVLYCRFCKVAFLSLKLFTEHFCAQHSGEKRYECPICERQYNNWRTFGQHFVNHAKAERLKVAEDMARTVATSNLTDMNLTCSCPLLYCDICKKLHLDPESHSNHVKGHRKAELNYLCSICGVRMARISSVNQHEPRHYKDVRRFKCDICGKDFVGKDDLKNHVLRHTSTKRFPCTVCGKKFKSKHYLDTHMRYHNGEKPFACNVCGKMFAQSSNRNAHQKTHLVES